MKGPLVKLYIVIIAALIAAVVLVPSIVGKTATWAVAAVTQADVALYNSRQAAAGDTAVEADGARAVIVMDDGWATQYTYGYDILSGYGFRACIAVVPSLVDTEGYMTYQQLAEVYIDGWDLLNHTYDHLDLTKLCPQAQARQVVDARRWLEGHQFVSGSNIVVYPQGAHNDVTVAVLAGNGFAAGRSLRTVWDAGIDCTREDIEICNLLGDTTLDDVKAAIDKAISNQSAVILMLHKIAPETDGSQMQISEELFTQAVDYLDAHSGSIRVVTMTELMAAD